MGIFREFLKEIAGHYFERVFTPGGMLAGMLLALAIWFIESAGRELFRHPWYSVLLFVAGGSIAAGIFLFGDLSAADSLRCLSAAAFFYLSYRGIAILSARRRTKQR